MHASEVPNTACRRFSPSIAEQPEPGLRLLHGVQVSSRKYGQRVRCIRLPPIDAMLRICGDALRSSACEIAGKFWRMYGCAARSLMRAIAPMRTPPFTGPIVPIGSALMSTMCVGRSTSHFSRSTRFVPPAMNFAPSREPDFTAAGISCSRTKSNGFTDRLRNAHVAAAATDIAARPLANLGVRSRVALANERDRRADLARRAVAALKTVLADECG